jgi:hypothetical protein
MIAIEKPIQIDQALIKNGLKGSGIVGRVTPRARTLVAAPAGCHTRRETYSYYLDQYRGT